MGVVEEAEGDVACAAGDVQDVLGGGRGGGRKGGEARVEGRDEVVFPDAVPAEGHEVVHFVVRVCHGREDGGDEGAFLGGGHGGEAEVGFFV